MVEYSEGGDIALFNGNYFMRDKMTGYFLSSGKICGRRIRLHRAVTGAKRARYGILYTRRK